MMRRFAITVFALTFTALLSTAREPMKIRPKHCLNAAGENGTCMFVWECIKTEGRHLGTCVDGFLFGSCCAHNDGINSIDGHGTQGDESSTFQASSISQAMIWKQQQTTTTNKPKIPAITSTKTPTNISTPKPTLKPVVIQSSKPIAFTSKPLTLLPEATSLKPSQAVALKPTNIIITKNTFNTTIKPDKISNKNKPFIINASDLNHNQKPQKYPIVSIKPANKPSHFPMFANNGFSNFLKPSGFNPIMNNWSSNNNYGKFPAHLITNLISTTKSSTSTTTSTTTSTPSTISTTEISSTLVETTTLKGISKRPSSPKECGEKGNKLKANPKVVGGKNSAFGAWPWQVSVRRTSFYGFTSTHRCGGALLNNQWIATAGHCVDDLLLTQIRIRVGEYDFSSGHEPLPHIETKAKKKIVHPKYNFFTYENDLALVQLEEPIEFQSHVSPICLPPDDVNLLGKNATVTGWGRLSEGGVLPSILQEVRVPIIDNDKCKNMFLSAGRHEYIPEIFMCAGYDEGGRDSCQGDSGGPLQVQGEDGRWFLAGIISWGIGCGEPSLPGVCTRITKFKQWILSYINADL